MINGLKPTKGRLLDIGCYEGYFLEQAKTHGWECYGVEPDIGAARYANEQLHLNVKQCILENAEYEDNYFDAITILAALEHVPDPSKLLREVKRILKPDGVLLVSVPTIPSYLPLIKSKWRMFIGDHYFFFTDQALQKLLEKVGMKLVASKYVTKNVDLDTISARLAEDWQPNNLGKFGKSLRKFILFLKIEKIRFNINMFDTKIYTITSA
jgi:2-polyprenyl-3-methyl-5-hydroxy-6-metoxy-1,4-benzoquinol methylase